MTTDLRALLGDDRYDEVIWAFVDATADEPDYFGCSCCTSTTRADVERTGHSWDDDHIAPAARMAAHDGLAAVLPDLLTAAWDEGYQARKLDEPYVKSWHTPNPYRAEETR